MKAADFNWTQARAEAQTQQAQLKIAISRGGHMKVRILRAGKYSDFSTPPRVRSKKLIVGDEAEFPGKYAESLIEKGYAEPVAEEPFETEGLVAAFKELDASLKAGAEGAEAEGELVEPDVQEPEIDATPRGAFLAREKGLDLRYIAGTGRGGRITAKDVREAISGAGA